MNPNRLQPAAPFATRASITEIGSELRSALSAVLMGVGGVQSRPVALAKQLGIDDSLAARVLRSVRAGDALSSLRELPAPQGLRLFLDAAARARAAAPTRERAGAAVSRFAQLLNELPLGRASLDTAIDGWLPSGRARAERAGKQAVFKALSQTLGFAVDTCCFAVAIAPSAGGAGDCCDAISFIAMDGIRRLREGAPILLLSHNRPSADDPRDGLPTPIVETLDGEREFTDARKLLLPDVGLGRALPVRLVERGHHSRIVLESSTPPLNVPISAAAAYLTRHQFRRYRTGACTTEAILNAPKVPIRALVQDLFIHEDVFPAFAPNVVARMDGLSFDPLAQDQEMLDLDRLELDVDMVRLGWGLDRVGVREWGGYQGALQSTFERSGWDAARFRAYRCYVRYPLPYVTLTTWFDLPAPP